jgi:hypothetical protein
MDLNTIRRALRDEPFEPFILKLADGRTETVKHPEFVAVGNRIVAIVREDNSVTTVEPLLIVSLDKEPPGSKKSGNGSTRSRKA